MGKFWEEIHKQLGIYGYKLGLKSMEKLSNYIRNNTNYRFVGNWKW